MSKKQDQTGFTIIELLVVIVVIGVLLGVVALAYQGVLASNRNRDRAKSINAVQKQLEAYYQVNNHYPSYANMNEPTWLADNMDGLDLALLEDPSGTQPTVTNTPVANSFAYQPLTNDNTSCEADNTTCVKYTLTATLEGGGTYVKQNND